MGDFLKGLGKKKAAKSQAKGIDASFQNAQPFFDRASEAVTRLDPLVTQGADAAATQAGLLGIGGDPAAAQQAFSNYLNSTGYKFRLGEGTRAITGSAAARGLLNSGSTLKRLTQFGQGLASDEFSNYFNQTGSLAQRGLGAAGLQSSVQSNLGGNYFDIGAQRAGVAAQGKGQLLNAGGNAINSILNAYTLGAAGLSTS